MGDDDVEDVQRRLSDLGARSEAVALVIGSLRPADIAGLDAARRNLADANRLLAQVEPENADSAARIADLADRIREIDATLDSQVATSSATTIYGQTLATVRAMLAMVLAARS